MDQFCARAMPYIKPDLTGKAGPAVALEHDDSPVLRVLGNGLLVAYLVDCEDSFEYVQNRHLSEAGINEDELHATAMNNLRAFMADRTRIQPHGNIFALLLDDNFEASLLLVDELWDDALAGSVQNGFVIAVPARDVLGFADVKSSAGIAELREVVARIFPGGDHLISQDLYRRKSGRWIKIESGRGKSEARSRRDRRL
jgi:uncharacterized protein YtpQ (UPF0354 family)